MRSATAKSLREQVYYYCQQVKHPFPKRVYRQIKKLYRATPHNLKHRFNVAQGKVI